MIGVVVLAGDDGSGPESALEAEAPAGDGPGRGGNHAENGDSNRRRPHPRKQDGGADAGSGGSPALPASQAPPASTPYGPPGEPAGEVAPGSGPAANEKAVIRTLRTFLAAIERGDGPEACAQLSRTGRARVERELREAAPETQGTPCEGAIVLYQGGYGKSIRNPRFRNLRVTAATASAIGPPEEPAALRKYGRTWLIDNYGW